MSRPSPSTLWIFRLKTCRHVSTSSFCFTSIVTPYQLSSRSCSGAPSLCTGNIRNCLAPSLSGSASLRHSLTLPLWSTSVGARASFRHAHLGCPGRSFQKIFFHGTLSIVFFDDQHSLCRRSHRCSDRSGMMCVLRHPDRERQKARKA